MRKLRVFRHARLASRAIFTSLSLSPLGEKSASAGEGGGGGGGRDNRGISVPRSDHQEGPHDPEGRRSARRCHDSHNQSVFGTVPGLSLRETRLPRTNHRSPPFSGERRASEKVINETFSPIFLVVFFLPLGSPLPPSLSLDSVRVRVPAQRRRNLVIRRVLVLFRR